MANTVSVCSLLFSVFATRAANDPYVFTIKEKAPTRAFSWLKALSYYAKRALNHSKWLWRGPSTWLWKLRRWFVCSSTSYCVTWPQRGTKYLPTMSAADYRIQIRFRRAGRRSGWAQQHASLFLITEVYCWQLRSWSFYSIIHNSDRFFHQNKSETEKIKIVQC